MSLVKIDPIYKEFTIALKFLDDLNGRDKLTKAVQYALKAFIDFSESYPDADQKPSLWNKRFNSAHNQLSAARKVFRIFKFFSIYTSIIKIIDRIGTNGDWKIKEYLDSANDLKTMFMGGYLFYDTINWAGKSELLPQTEYRFFKFSQKSYKDKLVAGYFYWMYSTIIGVIMDIVKLRLWYTGLLKERKTIVNNELNKLKEEGKTVEKVTISKTHKMAYEISLKKMNPELYKLIRTLIKDVCDFLVSAHYSGYWSPKQRWIGLFGVISSILAGWDVYMAARKQ